MKRICQRKTMKLGFICIISLVLAACTWLYFGDVSDLTAEANEVLPGVTVKGVDFSRLQWQEGMEKLTDLEEELQKSYVFLLFNGIKHEVALGSLGLTIKKNETMQRVMAVDDDLNLLQRWRAQLKPVECPLSPVFELDKGKVEKVLQDIIGSFHEDAVNAHLEIDGKDVQIVPSQNGYDIDINQFCNQLISNLNKVKEAQFTIPVKEIIPEVTTEEVQGWGITGMVAKYTTYFKAEQVNRNHNISIAALALKDQLVEPGGSFSFNEVVGPREAEYGYKPAGVIVGNELQEGMGGGVCQVSTTLYNAVLLADLAIEQRSSHSLPVSYVPIGLDAAVAYGLLDFKFRNTTDKHVLIKTEINNTALTVKVFGKKNHNRSVILNSWINKTIEPRVIYEEDSKITPGEQKIIQKGAQGIKAAAQRIVLEDGKEIKREFLPSSNYLPVESIIALHSLAEQPDKEKEIKQKDETININSENETDTNTVLEESDQEQIPVSLN